MSLPRSRVLEPGSLWVAILDFDAGDILPMHAHPPEDAHITLITRGWFIVRTAKSVNDYGPGTYLDFPAGTSHEFEAMQNNSRIVNIRKR